jgi:hypothetical protein
MIFTGNETSIFGVISHNATFDDTRVMLQRCISLSLQENSDWQTIFRVYVLIYCTEHLGLAKGDLSFEFGSVYRLHFCLEMRECWHEHEEFLSRLHLQYEHGFNRWHDDKLLDSGVPCFSDRPRLAYATLRGFHVTLMPLVNTSPKKVLHERIDFWRFLEVPSIWSMFSFLLVSFPLAIDQVIPFHSVFFLVHLSVYVPIVGGKFLWCFAESILILSCFCAWGYP